MVNIKAHGCYLNPNFKTVLGSPEEFHSNSAVCLLFIPTEGPTMLEGPNLPSIFEDEDEREVQEARDELLDNPSRSTHEQTFPT